MAVFVQQKAALFTCWSLLLEAAAELTCVGAQVGAAEHGFRVFAPKLACTSTDGSKQQ